MNKLIYKCEEKGIFAAIVEYLVRNIGALGFIFILVSMQIKIILITKNLKIYFCFNVKSCSLIV